MQITQLSCSGCGGDISPEMTSCKYCGRAIVISRFDTLSQLDAAQLKAVIKSLEAGNCAKAVNKEAPDTGDTGNVNFSLGSCYLKLALYDKALEKFNAAIDEEYANPENYFYAAVALLKGKKAFLTPMADIKKAIEYVNAAIMLEEKGIYHFFLSYIKYDFYARKSLNVSPSWQTEFAAACNTGVSAQEINNLFALLKVQRPEVFIFSQTTAEQKKEKRPGFFKRLLCFLLGRS